MESLESLAQYKPSATPRKSHILAFTSGKSEVGKTTITTNVAAAMVKRDARVCIFDADSGSANINIVFGLQPEFTIEHVLTGEKSITEVMITTDSGIGVVPGAAGIAECAKLSDEEAERLVEALLELESEYDYILIDTAAGGAGSALQFIESAHCAFLIITPEPTSLTDAFTMLKTLNGRNYQGRLRVIVNLVEDYQSAIETYRRFATAVEKYLQLKVEYGGFVAIDENVSKSAEMQATVVELDLNSPASRCMIALADNVVKYIGSKEVESGLTDYWCNLLADIDATSEKLEDDNSVTDIKVGAEQTMNLNRGETLNVGDPCQSLLAGIKSQQFEREKLEKFSVDFFSVFVEQFGGFPQGFRQLIYRWQEVEKYAAPGILELITTLEALYVSRYQQPLFALEDSAARLVAQTRGEESRLRELLNQFRSAYRQSFQVDAFDAEKEILDSINRDEFTEEDFEHLWQQLRVGFESRFNKPYLGQSDLLLESTAEQLAAMAAEEKQLQEEIELLTQGFQHLSGRRDALLAAIKVVQDHIHLKPVVASPL
jgi:flagellar biosynthesis protein FlhG